MARWTTGAVRADRAHFELQVFPTPLGWFGLLGRIDSLQRIYISQPSAAAVETVCRSEHGENPVALTAWNCELAGRLTRFTEGEAISFADVQIQWPVPQTEFRRRVIAQTRKIGRGETLTYAEVARRAESPRAARAVGTAMATNLFPIVIPCHRVVGSNGRLGGFTAPGGVHLKRRLLKMEADSSL
ncbi:MAG: MGMT family protein [Planctomycetaceae bacterium]